MKHLNHFETKSATVTKAYNRNAKKQEAPVYYHVKMGSESFLLTNNEMQRGLLRAKKQPEDCKQQNLFARLFNF